MKKTFYSHLVNVDSLTLEIHALEMTDEEKANLLHLIDSSLHHMILDVILSELSEEDKRIFLTHLAHDNTDKLWEHLNSKVDNIEEKIKRAATSLKAELYKDIHDTKKKHE